MAQITINGISFDPDQPTPMAAAAAPMAADAASSNYILVQTSAPLTREQREQMEKLGAYVLEYVPENTYICRYEPNDLHVIRDLPFVRWANVYMRGFKIAPKLAGFDDSTKVRIMEEVVARPVAEVATNRTPKTVDITLHSNAKAEDVARKIAEAAGVNAEDVKVGRHKVRLTVQRHRLQAVANIDEVKQIQEAPEFKLHNDVARTILRLQNSTAGGATQFEGDGELVAIADTGFDTGSTTNVHPAFTGRVVKLYALGRPGKANDPDGHGTHVAGSAVGDGDSTALGLKIRGTAPKAKLLLQSVLDLFGSLGGLPDDLTDLFSQAYQDGARIHTNSWGSTRGDGSYDANARELDDFVWTNRDAVICFAAGNEARDGDSDGQIDPNSVTPPGTAKNCITVGATENDRPNFALTYGQGWPSEFPVAPIASDKVADNPDGMVAFSSRGPVSGRRVKPDVVAPGTYILSTRSRSTKSKGWALSADPLYFYEGGTSMATPLVAGCAAVAREILRKTKGIPSPSAALVKAILVNGATRISGQYSPPEVGLIPNSDEGFGRVDMANVLAGAPGVLHLEDESQQMDTGDESKVSVTIAASQTQLKATLVWTDAPGDALQNDLDLIVRASDGTECHGNVPFGDPSFDRVNNVEQVVWDKPPAGKFDVIVRAFRVTQAPQTFALIVRAS